MAPGCNACFGADDSDVTGGVALLFHGRFIFLFDSGATASLSLRIGTQGWEGSVACGVLLDSSSERLGSPTVLISL